MARKPAPPPPPPSSIRATSKKPAKPVAPSTNSAMTIREFSTMVAVSYNDYLARAAPGHHPKMHNAIDEAYLGPQFAEWSLDSDSTIEMPNRGGAPWGLESISPIFRVHENSSWRQHIEFLWNFLRTDFQVNANTSCGTHVHLSRAGGYSLADLKQICQSIIHFDPAFEALLPEDRLSNEYARSNWLDNANFGHRNLSRKQSIAVIQRASSMRELVLLMNPDHDKMFGWNFLYNLEPRGLV
ncbi:hypothetical protein P175DRAFT_0532266 [Aspergillus ochraceoroseus IBT 24754]|uniref:Amidoligase enzyme n=2 Tax=Aspergillus ochraceoroseus TaxID=138278 RepID=A0A2T5LX91_9EURO|nr:uncharacterized protein P175DRAFT_0532266 [Aspergillus ochraceoroseus IBT 24754]KKK21627.1 hypothetical protein AOCH_004058 [Aspergillus ochraceoroseus]PTU20901.1 hypothetical protein P175DRAFT_0532266 [Aspergillus ochraceoroseus IBT 24754]